MSEASTTTSKTPSLQTAPFDPRFPNTNQTKNCYQNYTDFFKCLTAKEKENSPPGPCMHFKRNYNSLCPNDWISQFDAQRENGTFPASLQP